MLVSSSVVVCNWCDDLFGMGLELGVPLGVFFLTVAITHPHHSSNYSHAGKSLKQGKLSVMIRPLYLELRINMLDLQCKPHASTTNYDQVITT